MLCLRFMRSMALQSARSGGIREPGSRRALSSLHSPLRPSTSTIPRCLQVSRQSIPLTPASSAETSSTSPDLMPKISSHPGLASIQIRCGPRDTFSPSHFVRKRRAGFLTRKRTKTGRKILKARQAKGRRSLSH